MFGSISETGWQSAQKCLEEADGLLQSPINDSLERICAFICSDDLSGSGSISVPTRRLLALGAIAKASNSQSYASSINGGQLAAEILLVRWSHDQTGTITGHDLEFWSLWWALMATLLPYCHPDQWPDALLSDFCDPDVLMAMNESTANKDMSKLAKSFIRKWQFGNKRHLPWANVKEIAPGWTQKISQFNDAQRYHELGRNLSEVGPSKNLAKAVEYCQRAAALGHRDSQHALSLKYLKGAGVPKDFKKAMAWAREAWRQGNKNAANTIGILYDQGAGVSKDPTEAAKWYRMSAERGNATAQTNLGNCYRMGRGVPEDDATAGEWYDKAARQKNANALGNLGLMYANGEGVIRDDVMALHLSLEAVKRGCDDMKENIEILRQQMTPEQIERAEGLKLYS